MTDQTEYSMQSTSWTTSKIKDIPLSESQNGLTRKVLRAEVIDNHADADKAVKFAVIHQRRGRGHEWSDLGGSSLAQLKAGEAAKLQLDTKETYSLYKHLANLYEIGKQGVRPGLTVLQVADEDRVIRTTSGRARLIQKLIDGEFGNEIWEHLAKADAELATRLSMTQIYRSRLESLNEFEQNLDSSRPEEYWKKFLKSNRWIFGASYIDIIDEDRIGIHHYTDIPLVVEGGFMDIVELKKPTFPFWAQDNRGEVYLYREKFPIPHRELQGAIAQLSGYILQAEKQVDSADFARDHGGAVPLKPRGTVVHGRSHQWSRDHWQAFRLLNDELHGIQVITFDHLLERAKKSLEGFCVPHEQPADVDGDSDWNDFPF